MGASLPPLLSLDLKGMVLENKDICKSSNGYLWKDVLEAQAMRRRLERKQRIKRMINGGHGWRMRTAKILMKRSALAESCRRPLNGIERRVRTLKKLVSNGNTMGLDGLFNETADYILALQMQAKVMQIMVKVLSGSNERD